MLYELYLSKLMGPILYLSKIMGPMLEGTIVTLQLFFVTIIFSIPLGLTLALARISKFKILKDFTGVYIWLLRGTPLLLQLFFIYFGLPYIPIVGVTLDRFPAAAITFILNYAAYFAEIFRAGIQSIDKGQYEASKALGMTYWQTMRRIILPQMVKRVLPPVSNETITLVKDTALVYAIGLSELLRAAKVAVQRDFTTVPFMIAAVFYLVMTLVLTWVFKKLEQKYALYE
ncbi:MAG: polar amino acid transport system permease protein [Clostridiales bacterium]|jgi:polar amino acid transport system permease protein|nr:polar amino acid transport system permease protein [Clostridiales bacterium]MDK2934148.1 polar amino acid transport system permease protein [Clostridiales bacterium]